VNENLNKSNLTINTSITNKHQQKKDLPWIEDKAKEMLQSNQIAIRKKKSSLITTSKNSGTQSKDKI
jgi:hypothetical protein